MNDLHSMLAIAQGRIGDGNYGCREDHKGQQLELGHSCSPLRARMAIECNAKVQSIQAPTPNSMIQIGVVLYPGIAKNTAESGFKRRQTCSILCTKESVRDSSSLPHGRNGRLVTAKTTKWEMQPWRAETSPYTGHRKRGCLFWWSSFLDFMLPNQRGLKPEKRRRPFTPSGAKSTPPSPRRGSSAKPASGY